MHGVRFKLWFITLLLVFLASPVLAATNRGFSSDALPVFSDFDGDNKLDQAELFTHGAQKTIHISFGKLHWAFFTFDSGSTDRGSLISDDIDRDGDIDLLWFSQTSPRTFVVWLGDGQGNFSIVQGHDQDLLQAELSGIKQTGLTDDTDAEESTCIEQSSSQAELEQVASLLYDDRSERAAILIQPSYIPSPRPSVLFERGPPARLS